MYSQAALMLTFVLFLFSRATQAESTSAGCCETIRITPKTEISDYSEQGENFNPQMLYLVDRGSNTFLFRGNMPQMNGNFDYVDVTQSIADQLEKLGVSLSPNYKLLDLSFLNPKSESQEIAVETDWFAENPETGCFWLNSLYGSFFDPLDFPEEIRDFIIRHHDVDGLKTFIPQVRNFLQQSCTTDFVVYMHCNAGKDRTGEAAACYLMQYKGYSYDNAVELDFKIAGRPVQNHEMNAIRWYAFYLRDIEGMATIGSIEGR